MSTDGFLHDFRRFFLRGLGALVPTLATIAIIVWAFRLINDNVGAFITEGMLELCVWVSPVTPDGWVDLERDPIRYGTPLNEWDASGRRITVERHIIDNYRKALDSNGLRGAELEQARNRAVWRLVFRKYRLQLLGFVIGICLVYFVGFFLASFIGRTSWRAAEGLLMRIPLIRAIYPNVKQVSDFLLSERSVEFSGVVAVEYPRKGTWALGLSTGMPMRQLQTQVSDELMTVFIPSSPTPVTGYVIQVPRDQVIELNMSIDEGLRFTISAGVIKPEAALPGKVADPKDA